jgi:tRNA pseudouridine38-40 synthase
MGKHYRYRVLDQATRSPLRRHQVLHLYHPVDVERAREAATHLLGTHDFSTFRAAGCSSQSATKTITRLEIRRVEDEVHFDVEGSGFLRHMVRAIVGTLLQVSAGRFEPGTLPQMLAAQNRQVAGKTSPPHGLTLVRVHYPDGWPATG